MSVKGRGAVRTDDPKILKSVVVSNPVFVIEDHRHVAPAPRLPLTAQLATGLLQALLIKAPLQIAPGIARAFDENLMSGRFGFLIRSMTPA
jgi:hypothetical protein